MMVDLRLLMLLGGMAALLLHLAAKASGGWAALLLMYLCLPGIVWLRRTGLARWAAAGFAFTFGFCLVDEALSWGWA